MWIDAHCHLDAGDFDADRDAVVAQSRAAGVDRIVMPAVARWNFDAVRTLAHRHAGCSYALGIHPTYTAQVSDDDLLGLRRQVATSMDDPRFMAIGKIGLDLFIPDYDVERQNVVFRVQLRIAHEFGLPVLMHVCRSQGQVQSVVAKAGVRGTAHASNGSPEQAYRFVDSGFKLGFSGVFTFSRANRVHRLAQDMPIESIALETDTPDLAPAWLAGDQFGVQGGVRNAPTEVARIADAMTQLRGISIEALAEQTRRNSVGAIPHLEAFLQAWRSHTRLRLTDFVAGCVALQMQATLLSVWLPLGVPVLCLLLAAVLRHRLTLFHVSLVVAAVAAGFGRSDWCAQQRMAVAPGPTWEGKDTVATGVVIELPQLDDDATRFLLYIESSNAGGAMPPRVRLSWYGTCTWGNVGEEDAKPDRRAGIPDLQPGQRWQLTLRLKCPHSLTNPDDLDGEYAMLADNIRAVGYVRTGKRVQNIALDEAGASFRIGAER